LAASVALAVVRSNTAAAQQAAAGSGTVTPDIEHADTDSDQPRTDEGNSRLCSIGGNMPHAVPSSFADGIEGIRFTPGNPFAIRGGLQVFF